MYKILYHGSVTPVPEIDLSHSAPNKDFGRGFYTTADKVQAEKFARLKAKRATVPAGVVSVYSFHETEGLHIREFALSDEEWFDFVLLNRGFGALTSTADHNGHDIVTGPVANDAVGLVLNQFIAGVYGDPADKESKALAIRLLLTQNLHSQIFFGTELAVSCLHFLEAYDVQVDG
jgi:hypothetical protein